VLMNIGNPISDSRVIWRVGDIRINNTYENDYGVVHEGGEFKTSPLNASGLDYSSNNLTMRTYFLYDSLLEGWMQTWWSNDSWRNGDVVVNSSYVFQVYDESSDYNARVSISFKPGYLDTGDWVATELWWEDAICSWSCHLNAPTSNVEIQEGESFDLNSSVTWAGTCSGLGSSITAQFSNGSYYSISSNTNLSSANFNPVRWVRNGWVYKWVVVGEDPWDSLYRVRAKCYFNLGTKYSTAPTVNVTPAEHMVCDALSGDKTLTSDEHSCYYFTSDNIDFDCAGHTLYGDNDNYGISTNGRNNGVIKNCHFENYSKTIEVNHSSNTKIYNVSMAYSDVYTPSMKQDAVGVYIEHSDGTLIENVTQWNFTVDRGGQSGAGGYGTFVYITKSNNTDIVNTAHYNNTGDYHSGGGDPTTLTDGYGIRAAYDFNNVTIYNSTASGHTGYSFIFYENAGDGYGVSLDKIDVTNSHSVIASYVPININDAKISNPPASSETAIYISSGFASYSNITNVDISSEGVLWYNGISINTANIIQYENVSVSGTQTGFKLNGNSGFSVFKNIVINDSARGMYIFGANNKIDNLTVVNTNQSIEFALATNTLISNSSFIQEESSSESTFVSMYSGGIKFINTTANYSNITYNNGDSDFLVQWYSRVNVTDKNGGQVEALINDIDNQGNVAFYGVGGLTSFYLVNDTKYAKSGDVLYNAHLLNVSKVGYIGNVSYWNFTGVRDWTVNVTLYSSGLIEEIPSLVMVNNINLPTYMNVFGSVRRGILLLGPVVQCVKWFGYWY